MHPLIPFFEPFAYSLGPLTIHGFGILVALGFLTGSSVAAARAKQFGGDPELINRLVSWLIAGTFIGGHLGDVLWYRPKDLDKDPALFKQMFTTVFSGHVPTSADIPLILRVWDGLSSTGGFFVCVPLTVWFFWKEKKPFWPHAEGVAIGLTLGWFFGRMGCFSAHDHPGTQTEFWLGVYGMCPGNNPTIACHDLGLYEGLWSGAMFLVFSALAMKPRFPGFYCGLLSLSYGLIRFPMDFFRTASIDVRYAGLTPAQYGSFAFVAIGVWTLWSQRKQTALGSTVSKPA